jgi:hypothetical protein
MMRLIYIVPFCLALCSCKPKEMSLTELKSFIVDQDNGLQQSAEVNGTKVSVTFRPTDMWVDQEVHGGRVDEKTLDSLRQKYARYYYFILSVSKSDEEALHMTGDMDRYSQLVETMSFRMREYVTLTTTSQDTIPIGDFMMNRTYGLGSSTDILFSFDKEKALNDGWVQFNLNEFGLGLGNKRFRFATSDLENSPNVRFITMN